MKKGVIFSILVIIVLMSSCVSSGPAKDAPGMILLDSVDAELITDDSMFYEDYEGRYCVGHWKSLNDQIIWDFEVPAAHSRPGRLPRPQLPVLQAEPR